LCIKRCWSSAADYWLDVAEFERLSDSPEHLARAVELYSGALLPELYEDWIARERERLRGLYLADLGQLVRVSRARGDYDQALAYGQKILSCDPLREESLRDLMRLYCQVGDRAGALQAYQRFEGRLEEEIGVAPMAETRALYEAVVVQAPLPDIASAADVVQLAPPVYPHNLPAQLNTFLDGVRT
jgi:DNA-binding SARP family transcriptional activator